MKEIDSAFSETPHGSSQRVLAVVPTLPPLREGLVGDQQDFEADEL